MRRPATCAAALEVIRDGGPGSTCPRSSASGTASASTSTSRRRWRWSEVVIEPGMILTVEPIFLDLPNFQIGNFAMEQILLVTETGTELLRRSPTSLDRAPCPEARRFEQ